MFVAVVYALLAAFTKVFYKNKSVSELSEIERDILYNRAKLSTKVVVFILNLFGSFIAPPVYIISGLIILMMYLVNLII